MDNFQKKRFMYIYTFQTDTFFSFFCWAFGACLPSFFCPFLRFWPLLVVAGLGAGLGTFFEPFLDAAYGSKIKMLRSVQSFLTTWLSL